MSDRPTFDPGFSTEEMTGIFDAAGTAKAILEFEGALASSLIEVGIAPAEEAAPIVEACSRPIPDPDGVLASTWERGTPMLELGELVTSELPESSRRWFHHGATTQDAVDSGLMIQAARGLEAITHHLDTIAAALRRLAVTHRDQPQMGRTFLQQATPTTFGLTAARWLSAVTRHRTELPQVRDGLLVQLGGSTGTRDAYGEKGAELVDALARRLGLRPSTLAWHADRTPVLAVVHAVERTARTMAKIATDVALLASTEIGEITVRSGGSSSMPEKENPIDSIRAIAAAAACDGAVAMITSAPPLEMERGVGGWHVEWLAVPLVFSTAGAAVEAVETSLRSLRVNDEVMASRVAASERARIVAGAAPQIDRLLAVSEKDQT